MWHENVEVVRSQEVVACPATDFVRLFGEDGQWATLTEAVAPLFQSDFESERSGCVRDRRVVSGSASGYSRRTRWLATEGGARWQA